MFGYKLEWKCAQHIFELFVHVGEVWGCMRLRWRCKSTYVGTPAIIHVVHAVDMSHNTIVSHYVLV